MDCFCILDCISYIRRGLTKLDPFMNRGDEVESQPFLCLEGINGKILSWIVKYCCLVVDGDDYWL